MARELIVHSLAGIGDDAAALYCGVRRALATRGWGARLWSTARHPDVAGWRLPSSWDIGRWPSLWPQLDWAGARTLIDRHMAEELDVDRWAPRVAALVRQDDAPARALGLSRLEVAYVVARHIVRRPGLRRLAAWNPACPHGGIAAELAAGLGLDVTSFERGFLPDTWMVDRGGLMGRSTLAGVSLESLLERFELGFDAAAERGAARLATTAWSRFERHAQPARGWTPRQTSRRRVAVLGSDDVSNALVPASHPDRSVTSPGFRSSLALARAVAAARPDLDVAYKAHPSLRLGGVEPGSVDDPPNLERVDADFRALIEGADVCATLGSTTGFVALASGRPLVVAAREVLTGKGVALEALESHALSGAVERALSGEGFAERHERFAALVGVLDARVLVRADQPERLTAQLLA